MIPLFLFFLPISCATHSMAFINCTGNGYMHDVGFVFIQPQDRGSLSVGDIVAYSPTIEQRYVGKQTGLYARQTYIVHRIIGKTATGYIIKGDNNAQPDNDFFGQIRFYQVSYKAML